MVDRLAQLSPGTLSSKTEAIADVVLSVATIYQSGLRDGNLVVGKYNCQDSRRTVMPVLELAINEFTQIPRPSVRVLFLIDPYTYTVLSHCIVIVIHNTIQSGERRKSKKWLQIHQQAVHVS